MTKIKWTHLMCGSDKGECFHLLHVIEVTQLTYLSTFITLNSKKVFEKQLKFS